ncbi:MAG: hypothetical protein ACQ9IQ_15655, partial [Nitrospirales bacterium]
VSARPFTDSELIEMSDGLEQRAEAMLEAERGKPFVPAEIVYNWRGEGNHFSRKYCQSVTRFAMISFLLNDQTKEANEALQEMCTFFLGHHNSMFNDDSFYWAGELYVRIYEFFNTRNPLKATRLTPETEALLLKMMWAWSKERSNVEAVKLKVERGTWYYHSTENHVAMEYATALGFAQILKQLPEYANRKYDDGYTAEEHCSTMEIWHKEFCRERARRGMFFEIGSPGYNVRTLIGFYNIHDFSKDEELRALAGKLLNLWWAEWAQEQIDGVQGGGKARIRGWNALVGTHKATGFTWYYLGSGTPMESYTESLVVTTSQYRLPLVIMDLIMDVEGRGVYEITQRRIGLAVGEHNRPPDSWFRSDFGGILRYSYCTPEFILGTNMREARPQSDWHLGASQSVFHGVIFDGAKNARIVPKCSNKGGDTFNEQWSVQKKSTLIAQKLKTHQKAEDMMVWISSSTLSEPLEENAWVFVEAKGAFAAVRPVTGGYTWAPRPAKAYEGKFLVCENEWSPVILEVGRKVDYTDFAAFRKAVLTQPLAFEEDVLRYTSLSGNEFVFYADQSQSPKIDGKTVDYTPEMVFDGPFVRSKWLSGEVTIRKGNRSLILDFND